MRWNVHKVKYTKKRQSDPQEKRVLWHRNYVIIADKNLLLIFTVSDASLFSVCIADSAISAERRFGRLTTLYFASLISVEAWMKHFRRLTTEMRNRREK